jgi:heat shock protein HslJ/membrane-bound inhibitor of C-type lysozyme
MRLPHLALAAALAAPIAAAEAAGPPLTTLYDCGGTPILTRMGEGGAGATMRIGEETYALVPVVSASGARFEAEGDPSTVFWSKGMEATVTRAGEDLPACALSEEPGWSAQGNEPFWTAGLRGLTLALDRLGEDAEALDLAGPVWADGALVLEGEGVVLRSVAAICRDTMTGMPYPETVEIAMGDDTLRGCGGDPVSLLEGGEWVVEDIGGGGLPDDARVTLAFDGSGRVAGAGGCNRWSGGYTLTGEGLTFGPAAATRMACAPALMEVEGRFFAALEQVMGFDMDETGSLRLLGPDGAALLVARR